MAANPAPELRLASAADLERAQPIIERSPLTYPNLAYRGDKALLLSEDGRALLMYGRMGRTWVAMGDPVGPDDAARALARRFRDQCRRRHGWPAFFEVRPERRQWYLEMGLALTPLGEEARVELARFDLAAAHFAGLRRKVMHARRAGSSFEIVPPGEVVALLPELARVSRAWLAAKATREKGFSNASFDAGYLARFPLALVRREGAIVAFANLWQGAGREELSVDLMRHVPHGPNGTMDLLFCELLAWGRAQGYRWFNFGCAPLSGLNGAGESPLWRRLGSFVYRHAEHFYNFKGLRAYKAKFHPVWTPLYLASPGGAALPVVLLDVVALVAGGYRGVFAR